MDRPNNSIKSKQRVADHGEVFTPVWLDAAMLDLEQDFHLRVRFKVFDTEQMNKVVFAFRRNRSCVAPLHRSIATQD